MILETNRQTSPAIPQEENALEYVALVMLSGAPAP
jgi:hypothetical protein